MIDSTYATGIWTDLVRTKKTLTLDDCLPPLDQVCYKHFNWLLCVSMYTINCHCLSLFVPYKNNKQLVIFLKCNDYFELKLNDNNLIRESIKSLFKNHINSKNKSLMN